MFSLRRECNLFRTIWSPNPHRHALILRQAGRDGEKIFFPPNGLFMNELHPGTLKEKFQERIIETHTRPSYNVVLGNDFGDCLLSACVGYERFAKCSLKRESVIWLLHMKEGRKAKPLTIEGRRGYSSVPSAFF